MIPVADLLPPELTAIRATGVVIAVLVGGYAIARRRALRNADVLILLLVALGLARRHQPTFVVVDPAPVRRVAVALVREAAV